MSRFTTKRAKLVLAGLVLLALGMIAAACGSDNTPQYPNSYQNGQGVQSASYDETECIQNLTDDQVRQLQDYVHSNGDDVAKIQPDANQVESVCILQNSNGTMEQHYVNRQDNFNNYLLYAMLTGQGHSLAAAGVLYGDLDFSQALALQMLTSVRDDGGYYSPYTRSSDNRWYRQVPTTTNVHVTNVQYGNQPPVAYAKAPKAKSGYVATKIPSADANKEIVATKSSSSTSKSTVTAQARKPVPVPTYSNSSSGSAKSSPKTSPSTKVQAPPPPKPKVPTNTGTKPRK